MAESIECATAGTNTPLTTVACEWNVTQYKQICSQQPPMLIVENQPIRRDSVRWFRYRYQQFSFASTVSTASS